MGQRHPMDPSPILTNEIFGAFLKCRYKGYLKLRGAAGKKSDYGRSQAELAAEYTTLAQKVLLRRHSWATVIENPSSLPEALQAGAALIIGVTASDAGESCRLDALEKVSSMRDKLASAYTP